MTKAMTMLKTIAAVQKLLDRPSPGSEGLAPGSGSLPSSDHTIQLYSDGHDWELVSAEEIPDNYLWRAIARGRLNLIRCRICGTTTHDGIQEIRLPSCDEAVVRKVQES